MFLLDLRLRDAASLVLTALLVTSSLLLVTTARADGYATKGCKYDGSNPTIDYKFVNTNSRTERTLIGAQADWDATNAPGFFRADNAFRDSEIDVFDANYSRDSWAFVTYRCTSDGTYSSNEVDLSRNFRTTQDLTDAELRIVLVHELGHAYGLAHVTTGCTGSGPAVMRQGTGKFSCAGTAPWADDINGVHAIY